MVRRLIPLLIVCLAVACSGSDSTPSEDRPPPGSTESSIGINELLEEGANGVVNVDGFVIIDQTSTRLCEVLMESFPPQCGGASVEIANPGEPAGSNLPPDIELAEAQGVRWTDSRASLAGRFDGTRFILDELG